MSWLWNKLNSVYFLLLYFPSFLLSSSDRCLFSSIKWKAVPVRIILIIYPIYLPRCCKPSMPCCVPVTIASNYMIWPFRAPFCVLSVIATGECTFTCWIHTWLYQLIYIKLVLFNLWITSYEKELKYINLKYADRINFHRIKFRELKRNLCR